jgi:hypothetical protein
MVALLLGNENYFLPDKWLAIVFLKREETAFEPWGSK